MSYLTIIFLSLLGSFFFAGIEMGLVSIRRRRLQAMGQGNVDLPYIFDVLKDPKRMLITILIGNNFSIIVGSITAEHFFDILWPEWGYLISFISMTAVFFIFSEILPKLLFRLSPEYFVLSLSKILKWSFRIIHPLATFVAGVTTLFSKRTEESAKAEGTLTKDEFVMMIEEGKEDGVFSDVDKELIEFILNIGHLKVKDLMTPWNEVIQVRINQNINQIIQTIKSSLQDYAVVMDEEGLKVVGCIALRDLVFLNETPRDISGLLKSVVYFEKSSLASEVIAKIREKEVECAVLYKDGTPLGLIALSSLLKVF